MASLRTKIKQTRKQAGKGWEITKGQRGKLATAAFFDLLSAIPWVGVIFAGIGYGSLWLWMKLGDDGLNPSLFSGDMKKLASTAAEFLAGAIGLGIVPGITMWTFFVIAEAKTGQSAQEAVDVSVSRTDARGGENIVGQIRGGKRRRKTSAYMDEEDWTGKRAA